MGWKGEGGYLHVLVVRGSGVLLIGGDVDLGAGGDGNVIVVDGVTGTDLRALLCGCQHRILFGCLVGTGGERKGVGGGCLRCQGQ